MIRPDNKKKTLRDKGYLVWLSEQPPLVMGFGDTVAHHLKIFKSGSMGMKPPDTDCIPLADSTHRDVHQYGERRVLFERYGFTEKDLRVICDRYRAEYLDWQKRRAATNDGSGVG